LIKKNFLRAISRLKSRNQSFVDRNGATAWSKETDLIIDALVEYFNEREKIAGGREAARELIDKLLLIMRSHGVHNKELFLLPVEFLEYECNEIETDGSVNLDIRMQLIRILSDYNRHQVIIESLIQAVMNYREIEDQVVRKNILETWPQLSEYFYSPETGNLKTEIQNDYYAGRLKA